MIINFDVDDTILNNYNRNYRVRDKTEIRKKTSSVNCLTLTKLS